MIDGLQEAEKTPGVGDFLEGHSVGVDRLGPVQAKNDRRYSAMMRLAPV